MNRRGLRYGALATLATALAAAAALASGAAANGTRSAAVQPLPSSSCGPVEYKGSGTPDVLIASDFPMQGASRVQSVQTVKGIRFVLNQNRWTAGSKHVGFQACDDTTAQLGHWDSGKCAENARNYGSDPSVVGVIGTYNSGCAAIEIPILNQAPGGGVAIVSPANTFVCLTAAAPSCQKTEPEKYYPTGTRNYARVVAHDGYQGAADAQFLKSIGVKSVYILNDKEAYGLGVATNLKNALVKLNIKVAGFAAWDKNASNYQAQMEKIKATGAQAVYLGGLIDENGAQLIKDKVAVLGPNVSNPRKGVVLLAPDGFQSQATIDGAGKANAAGMFATVAGEPANRLTGKGKAFVNAFKRQYKAKELEPYTAYGAQATQIVLDAIANSDASRAGVISHIIGAKVKNGILGTFRITADGDPTVGPVTVYTAKATFKAYKVLTPSKSLVDAAMGKA